MVILAKAQQFREIIVYGKDISIENTYGNIADSEGNIVIIMALGVQLV